MAEARFSCRCGALTGRLVGIDPGEGTHLVCHCADCARADRAFGGAGDREQGVALWQTTPDRVMIEIGAEHLHLARLSPSGLNRWVAGCCGTPMFNTLNGPRLPFVGVLVSRLDSAAALGPVIAHGFIETPGGKSRHKGGLSVGARLVKRALRARLSGAWRATPFFDADSGAPVAEPEILPRDAGQA
ncbi:hypothetical protein HKCCSP123_14815 [Rhodobacterales bacterium HKCCSP123]|nr:hypothetical protein [Rhodobacterales bacterium HKCCSP123]